MATTKVITLADKTPVYYATGRRKSSVARVFIKTGTGKITINGKEEAEKYFPNKYLLLDLKRPLDLTGMTGRFDVRIFVKGGGYSAQEGAARLGIARALLLVNGDFRKVLKADGLITVDSRVVERKKYGLHKARKAPQFSKR